MAPESIKTMFHKNFDQAEGQSVRECRKKRDGIIVVVCPVDNYTLRSQFVFDNA